MTYAHTFDYYPETDNFIGHLLCYLDIDDDGQATLRNAYFGGQDILELLRPSMIDLIEIAGARDYRTEVA